MIIISHCQRALYMFKWKQHLKLAFCMFYSCPGDLAVIRIFYIIYIYLNSNVITAKIENQMNWTRRWLLRSHCRRYIWILTYMEQNVSVHIYHEMDGRSSSGGEWSGWQWCEENWYKRKKDNSCKYLPLDLLRTTRSHQTAVHCGSSSSPSACIQESSLLQPGASKSITGARIFFFPSSWAII